MDEQDFDIIRPFNDSEIEDAISRILADDTFHQMMNFLFSDEKRELVISNMKKTKTVAEFQNVFSLPSVLAILEKTTKGLTYTGFENIDDDDAYLYIANHRDIVLDSSIIGMAHMQLNKKPPRATWGSNLMVSQLIIDLGKSNNMVTVFRDGSPKELLLNSQRLSKFIRKSITEEKKSVWIAHSKGRTKNGFDRSDVSILKMLSLSGGKDIKERLIELNITPVTISYEWEPCDAMKVREIYLSKDNNYVKGENEDFLSILGGLTGEKGRIHLSVGVPLNDEIKIIDNSNINNNQLIGVVSELTDKQIHNNYKLWPSNYLAYDLLYNTTKYSDKYDEETISTFEKRYKNTTVIAENDNEEIRELFLLLYANPVINALK